MSLNPPDIRFKHADLIATMDLTASTINYYEPGIRPELARLCPNYEADNILWVATMSLIAYLSDNEFDNIYNQLLNSISVV